MKNELEIIYYFWSEQCYLAEWLDLNSIEDPCYECPLSTFGNCTENPELEICGQLERSIYHRKRYNHETN